MFNVPGSMFQAPSPLRAAAQHSTWCCSNSSGSRSGSIVVAGRVEQRQQPASSGTPGCRRVETHVFSMTMRTLEAVNASPHCAVPRPNLYRASAV
ncbi:hypothetical protein MN608_02048 [Microdochium nivale]|nr:hypothetical protein MN608_02048 [Microdochium nivale]